MYVTSYKELIVWQKSIMLVEQIYAATATFPHSETYNLVSQMRRATVSIPSNIAEGYGRKSSKEYQQFYSIAYGSGLELETQLIIAKKLNFIQPQDYQSIQVTLEEVLKMLHSMLIKIKTLNTKR